MLSSLLNADSSSLLHFRSSRVGKSLSLVLHRWPKLIGTAWKFGDGFRSLKSSFPLLSLSLGFIMLVFHFIILQQRILQ